MTLHIGRSWTGHPLEDGCPCAKAPCGLATTPADPDCPEHAWRAAKTLRQMYAAAECPACAAIDPTREDQP